MDYTVMEFPRPEYWTEYPFPSPGDLPNPGIELRSPTLQADSLPAEPQGKPKCGRLKVGKDFDRNQEVRIKSHIGDGRRWGRGRIYFEKN